MEFGLLGPLVVRARGAIVPVTAGKQRVLLAALLVRANQVVPTEELAEAMWGGRPPETARVTLQNYVKRLRHVLGPEGYERIVTRPAGYLVAAGPEELDVTRFAELATAGRAAARTRAWEQASAQLSAALSLWRGPALADVPSPRLVAAEAPRLAEMRLAATEARIDADLHLGRHQETIAELAALAEAEPLRERLHELLMLALYRSGQQAKALAAYRHARRQLIEQVGIEPGPALRELNQRILRSDPGLRPALARSRAAARTQPAQPLPDPGRPAAAPGQPAEQHSPGQSNLQRGRGLARQRPAMLPSAVPGFAGREAELSALTRLASPGAARHPGDPATIIAISGTAGVGKTALAVHWARQHTAEFPDGQLYLNFRGLGPVCDPLSPADALFALLDALGTPASRIPATLEGRQALYRTILAGQQILILLDNVRDAAHARPLLPGSPGPVTIVTSRNDLAGLIAADGARSLALDVLPPGEAREVLAVRLGPERVAAEPDAVAELTQLCACLPLALAITAARGASSPGFPLSGLAAELRDIRHRLDALSTGEDVTDTRAVFSFSYRSLDPAVARMFRLLGIHPGPDITAPAAASLAGCDADQARRLLRDLTREHLLTEHAPGRFILHDLLRAYAAERAEADESADDRRAATQRILDHYLHTVHAAAFHVTKVRDVITLAPRDPGATPEHITDIQHALAWFNAEHQVLAASIGLAAESGFDTVCWQLQWSMANFLDYGGHWDTSLQRTALAAATRQGDIVGQAVTLRLMARTFTRLGDYDQAGARLTQAIGLFRQVGDEPGEARAHQNASVVSERQGRYADALGHAEQAFALCDASGDLAGRASALADQGWYHALLGHHEQAREICEQTAVTFRELGEPYGEARSLDSLGFVQHQLGNFAAAADCYSQAIGLLRELGSRFYEAEALTHLGDAHEAAGDQQQADTAWRQALDILGDLGHSDAEQVRERLCHRGPPQEADGSAAGQLSALGAESIAT